MYHTYDKRDRYHWCRSVFTSRGGDEPRPIEHRLYRAIAGQLLAAIAISILVAYVFSTANLRHEFENAVQTQTASIREVVTGLIKRGDYVGVSEVGGVMVAIDHVSQLRIETASGYVLADVERQTPPIRHREDVELRDENGVLLGRMLIGFNDERYAEHRRMNFLLVIIGLVVFSMTSSVFMLSFVRAAVVKPLVSLSRRLSRHKPDTALLEDVSQFHTEEIRTLARLFRGLIEEITSIARTDAVTGIRNRFAFDNRIRSIAFPPSPEVAVVIVDIDHFKRLNDQLGHFICDGLLRKVGARLESVAGATADAYRLGGDEFAIVIVGTAEIERVIESIPNLFRNPIRLEGGESVQMTGSVGVARAPEDVMNAQDLLKAADMALYEAKRRGRNQVVSYSAALRHKVNAMTHTIDVASRPARPLVGDFICGQPGRLFAIDRRKGDNLRPLTARLSPATVDRSPSNEDPAVSGKPKLQDTA